MSPGAPILAFDIGGTHARAAIVEGGQVLAQRKEKLDDTEPERVTAQCARMAFALKEEHAASWQGVGVGVAAMLDTRRGLVLRAPNLGWVDVNFGVLLSEALHGPQVALANDLDAITMGEAHFGGGRGKDPVACVFVGTGVGSGLVVNGRPYTGVNGAATELGHLRVVPEGGRRCGCGANGCLEAYTGGGPLLVRIREAVDAGRSPLTASLAPIDALHIGHVVDAAAQGDHWAQDFLAEVTQILAVGVAGFVTLLSPEVLLLGGGVFDAAPSLKEAVVKQLGAFTNAAAFDALTVGDARLGDAAGLVGAAAVYRAAFSS